ncbi:WD40-repeat-containing domain protein [Hyaloraphidium curvatum]|nr:WD40-repeat-containing domain protein [Hyaloraphidium curvatum]
MGSQTEAGSSAVNVHRCRFVDYVPYAVNALEFTPASVPRPLLACGRANGDIEIRAPADDWHARKVIPGGTNYSIAGLCWLHQTEPLEDEDDDEDEDMDGTVRAERSARLAALPPRLLSSGHNGWITEWDLDTLAPKRRLDSNGGAVWCLAPNHANTVLAVGCEDGTIRLFDVADGNLEFQRALDRVDARLLSLVWSADDSSIFAGSSDSSVRKWDVQTGRVLQRMTVDREKREHTLVWAVELLADGQLVAGTSLGNLHIFSGDTCTIVQTLRKVHAADILCVAVNRAGTAIFSSGVDRKVVQLRRVDEFEGQNADVPPRLTWVVSGERRWHSHDVRALALWEEKPINSLVTGGVDTQLVTCPAQEFPNVAQKRLSPFPARSLLKLCPSQRLLMCRFSQSVKLWRLGSVEDVETSGDEGGKRRSAVELKESFRAVLEIQISGGHNLTCGDIAANGRWVAVADVEETKLFRLDPAADPVRVRKVNDLPFDEGAHALVFTPDCLRLIVADIYGAIRAIDLESMEVVKVFEHHVGRGGIVALAVSADGQWLASVDGRGHIESFNLDSLQHHATVPRLSSPVTAMAFHSTSHSILVVACVSNEFLCYDVEDRRFTDWMREYANDLPARFLGTGDKIVGIAFNPARPSTIIFWGVTFFVQVDLDKGKMPKDAIISQAKRKRIASQIKKLGPPLAPKPDAEPGAQKKVRKKHRHEDEKRERREKHRKLLEEKLGAPPEGDEGRDPRELASGTQFLKIHRYQPLMFLDFAGGNEMVAVERPWFGILESLPPSFYRKTYGGSG